MDEQEFLESMQDRRGESVEQIYGLLSGTSEYANIHQILDDLIIATFGRAFIIGATEQRQGRVEVIEMNPEDMSGPQQDTKRDLEKLYDDDRGIDPADEFRLGPCGCTDYHMADCPLMTDR